MSGDRSGEALTEQKRSVIAENDPRFERPVTTASDLSRAGSIVDLLAGVGSPAMSTLGGPGRDVAVKQLAAILAAVREEAIDCALVRAERTYRLTTRKRTAVVRGTDTKEKTR